MRLEPSKIPYEIIVVDNNSTDNSKEIITSYSDIIYLEEKRQGASFARNKGIFHSSGEIVIFLDADAYVDKAWLNEILKPFDNKKVGGVGGKICPVESNNIISRYLAVSLFLRYPSYKNKKNIRGYPSCSLAIRKELIESGFDVINFTTYFEDKDICYRVLEKGWNIIFSPEAIVYHHHPVSVGELLSLACKSSKGRLAFSKKYPLAKDILFLNYNIPLIYILILLLSSLCFSFSIFLSLLVLSFSVLGILCVRSYLDSNDAFVAFLIKPFLDILCVYTIYVSYTFQRIKSLNCLKKSKSK